MKNKIIIITLLSMLILAGCADSEKDRNYEVDTSYETELYGTYSDYSGSDELYSTSEAYTFSSDGTYSYNRIDVSDGETTDDIDESGEIISSNEISNNLSEITLSQGEIIYKYKNMIGFLEKVEVPKGKTFELNKEDGSPLFSEDGTYHSCRDASTCDCKNRLMHQYIRKDDIIYRQYAENDWRIFCYITDNGLFVPQVYKE